MDRSDYDSGENSGVNGKVKATGCGGQKQKTGQTRAKMTVVINVGPVPAKEAP